MITCLSVKGLFLMKNIKIFVLQTHFSVADNLNLETVRNVASRYNLGDEFTQRWYAWHAMEFVQS